MNIRKNLKNLINPDGTLTPELQTFKQALLDLKDPLLSPSLIAEAQLEGALSRYDDYVWIHFSLMAHIMDNDGPHHGHRGPAFFPWHREFIRRLEIDLQNVSGNPELTVPYWDWTRAQIAENAGYPFIDSFLGRNDNDEQPEVVTTGDFAQENGWDLNLEESETDGVLRPTPPYPLTRQLNSETPNLPTPTQVRNALQVAVYDSVPWNRTVAENISFRENLENRHNTVHVRIGGSMLPFTSPNDPVFFLHHCNVDRLWAVWMQKHPAVSHYLPAGSHQPGDPHGLTRLNDVMDTLSEYFGVPVTPADLLNHKPIAWYDSDLPEITLETPSVNFYDVPEGMTQYRAVRFHVRTVKPVTFRISTAPGGNFDTTSLGLTFTANPDPATEIISQLVWVQFHAMGGNAVQNSSVEIEASIIDEDGYHAATANTEFTKPEWQYTVNLSGRKIPRPDNAVALVLDRSGSMAAAAGGTGTRSLLLKSAVTVFYDLLRDDDEIGIVSFDDQVDTLLGMTRKNMADINSIVDGTGLDPRGETSIGGGIERGRTVLNSATAGYQQALIVLTDGNENFPPMISGVSDDINARTYAIGFGLPGGVSAPALETITQNNNGQLIITGNISSDEQRFLLSKYFIQVLAGVNGESVVLDPQGELTWESVHKTAFAVTEADISMDVIVLCPAPFVLGFTLITPGGKEIDAGTGSTELAIRFVEGRELSYYRLSLPALLSSPDDSHYGTWHAVLKLKGREEIQKLIRNHKELSMSNINITRGYIPYNLVIKSFTNLQFEASLSQNNFEQGASIKLHASLKENAVPIQNNATVYAELAAPGDSFHLIKFEQTAAGIYEAGFESTLAGLYTFRVRAEGYSIKGYPFTREQVLTAPIFKEYDQGANPNDDGYNRMCGILKCLLSENVMTPRFKKHLDKIGINADNLKECLLSGCDTSTQKTGQANTKRQTAEAKRLEKPLHHLLAEPNLGIEEPVTGRKIAKPKRPAINPENLKGFKRF